MCDPTHRHDRPAKLRMQPTAAISDERKVILAKRRSVHESEQRGIDYRAVNSSSPTLIIAFGASVKTAGTASLLISLPTVLVSVVRYTRCGALHNREDLTQTVAPMGVSSVVGWVIGGLLVGIIPSSVLKFGGSQSSSTSPPFASSAIATAPKKFYPHAERQ